MILEHSINVGLRTIIFLILFSMRMFCFHCDIYIRLHGEGHRDLEQFPLSVNITASTKSPFLGGRAGRTNIHLSEAIIM